MANKSYRKLTANRGYLRGVGVGSANHDVPHEERIDAENLAAIEIDAELGKTFSTSSPPPCDTAAR